MPEKPKPDVRLRPAPAPIPDALRVTRERWTPGPSGGRVYTASGFEVTGRILEKYLAYGGPSTNLGLPTATAVTEGTATWQAFSGGRIYATPAASEPVVIYGDILLHWLSLGGGTSPLGYPVTDELDVDEGAIDEGGRYNGFEHGALYYWPEDGVIVSGRNVRVDLTGIRTIHRTSGIGSDQPYLLLGMCHGGSGAAESLATGVTPTFEATDGTAIRLDPRLWYEGPPREVFVAVALLESDGTAATKDANLRFYAGSLGRLFSQAPAGFVPPSDSDGAFLVIEAPQGGEAIDQDDWLGQWTHRFSPHDLVQLAENGFMVSDGIAHKLESPGIGGKHAHYRVLLSVARADA